MSASEVMAAHQWRTNAALIVDVARLGYLDGTVLDVTYGEHGGFWKDWRPELLTTSDLHHPADRRWDYRSLPCADGEFDSVVFDPPYRMGGTPDRSDDRRFGNEKYVGREARLEDIRAGAVECYRVARRFLLVKCMDAVEGGRVRWQTDIVTRAVESAGGVKVDRFEFLKPSRPQPAGRQQRSARRNYSTLLVFGAGHDSGSRVIYREA